MRRLVVVATIGLAALALAAVAAQAQGGTKVYAPEDCSTPKVKPDRIVLTCADFGLYVNDFDWQDWGGKSSHGFGTLWANTCKPSCASGNFKHYPVAVTLKKPKPTRCVGANVYMYRKIKVDFIKREPSWADNLTSKLYCG